MAAHWDLKPKYSGYFTGMVEIARTEGHGALFRGLNATLVGVLPYAGMSFATFETLKAWSMIWLDIEESKDIPVAWRLILGGTAGFVAQTVTYPIHVVRRRMQVQPDLSYNGTWQALVEIYKTEGMKGGLFKGVVLTWIKAPIAVAISFCINDYIKMKLDQSHKEEIRDREIIIDENTMIGGDVPELKLRAMEQILLGGMAGALAKTVIAPGDRIKILYQVNPDRQFTLSKAWKTGSKIVKNNGVFALWRGNMATMMRIIPHSGIAYMTFDRTEEAVVFYTGQETKTPMSRFFAGAVAGGTATMVSYPFDLLRARMAAHWGTKAPYSGYTEALSQIIGKEGPKALYSGLKPTLMGVLPYSGISFATFGSLKSTVKKWYNLKSDKEIPTPLRLGCGAVAGLVAQSATYPLDIVRRRMQVQAGGPQAYTGVWNALSTIYAREGRPGLYKGLSMNWIKGPIAVAVSFTCNDSLKEYWVESKQKAAEENAGVAPRPTKHTN